MTDSAQANDKNIRFDQNVREWERQVRSHYIMTAFSDKPILDNSYAGSWVAFEGAEAEALFNDPMMLEPNPKLKLNHELMELEVLFDRLHEMRLKNKSVTSLRDAALQEGYFRPLFSTLRSAPTSSSISPTPDVISEAERLEFFKPKFRPWNPAKL